MAGTTSTQRYASRNEDKITICTEDTLNELVSQQTIFCVIN